MERLTWSLKLSPKDLEQLTTTLILRLLPHLGHSTTISSATRGLKSVTKTAREIKDRLEE